MKTNTPKLRFSEFQDAPAWKEKRLEAFADLYKGKGISKADISADGKIRCIRYGELYTSYSEIIETVLSATNLPASELFFSKKNDVIVPSSGETKEDISTASCVMLDDIALGGDLNVIRCDQCGNFISYYLNGQKKKEIVKIAQGDTVVHLYTKQLKQLEIALPEPLEQQKIADCLSSLDGLISTESRKLDALASYKKGLMQQLFPAEGETVPKLRFPEFRNAPEWEVASLESCLCSQPDYGVNAPGVPYSEKLPTYLRITDISEDRDFINEEKVSVNINATYENSLHEGDIVLARTGASVGKSYKYKCKDGELVFAGFLIRIRPDKQKLYPDFLYQFLDTERYWKWVGITSARSGQPGINATEYCGLPIPMPSPRDCELSWREQQKIADCLSSLDDLIAVQTEKLDGLKDFKKGMMQQLFPANSEVTI